MDAVVRKLISTMCAMGLSLSVQTCALAAEIQGVVVGVADGDTLTVLDSTHTQHKIRLSGIDAPEKSQPFGDRSKQSLSALTFGKRITVEWDKRDRYGRIVGKVITLNGTDANLEQIKAGMAWHYKMYEREQPREDRKAYADAERDARDTRMGLWQNAQSIPPWEYRKHASE
jgi:endonuclease YncB( thermonuclease family)